MIVCCDIDNTTTNMNRIWLQYINLEYGTNYKYSDITHWEFFDELVEQGLDVYEILERRSFWESTTVYPTAVKVLEALSRDGHKVFLVTASDPSNPSLQVKLTHVLSYFDKSLINIDNIVITQDKSIIDGDVLIDDKLETCQDWRSRGRVVCMPEQPWTPKFNPNSNCNQLSIFDGEDGDNMDVRWIGVLEYINKRFGLNLKIN